MARRKVLSQALFYMVYFLGALRATQTKLDESCLKHHSPIIPRSVNQSSLYNDDSTRNAEKAVDANPNTCFQTSLDGRPWWLLDLGKPTNVLMIVITNSNQHTPFLRIIVSQNVLQPQGYLCGFKHILAGGETRVIRCDPTRTGHIVKIETESRNQSLSLCEVEVFDDSVEFSEGVNYEAWFNIPLQKGVNPYSLSSLTSHVAFKNNLPSSEGIFESFQSPRNITSHYGMRLITYYNAPESGNYTFYMSGDDSCRLFLKHPGEHAGEIAKIPRDDSVPHWTAYDVWNGSTSSPQLLKKNQVYELTALMKQGEGQDHIRVGVRLPNGHYERPMKNRLYTSEHAAVMRSQNPCTTETVTPEVTTRTTEVFDIILPTTKAKGELESAVETLRQSRTSDETKLNILHELETFGVDRAKSLSLTNTTLASFVYRDKEFVLVAVALNLETFNGFTFPGLLANSSLFSGASVRFPGTIFPAKKGRAYVVCMTFQALEIMKKETGHTGNRLGKNIISVVVNPRPTSTLTKPVELVFENTANTSHYKDCVYWIEDSNSTTGATYGRWSNKGCLLVHKNTTHTVCQCNHLTKFAVLFPVSEGSREDERRLELITYIGLSLSSVGCFITFIVYHILRITKTLKTIVHLNLVLALGLADIMFLLGNFAKDNKAACLGSTILTFYLYLAVFGWMLIEGVHLYFLVIRVFGSDDCRRKRIYYIVGWGVPLLVVCITAGLMGYDLVAKKHCWLSAENKAIWAFIGPVVFVILINILILSAVLRTTLTVLRRDPGHCKERSAMRTLGLLVPILGITWILGIVTFAYESIITQYIFAICNAFQGFFIFVLYCLLNSEVRHEYQRKLIAWRTGREIESKRSKQNNSDFPINQDLLVERAAQGEKRDTDDSQDKGSLYPSTKEMTF